MDLSMPTIEELTGVQLRKLSLERKSDSHDGESDDFYAEDCIIDLEDNDELSIEEGAFMMGYLEALD